MNEISWVVPARPALTWRLKERTAIARAASEAERAVAALVGPAGPVGPRGPGGAGTTFAWSPPSALQQWMIPHNLGRHPSVSVADEEGVVGVPDVEYLDENTVLVRFAAPSAGVAYLN